MLVATVGLLVASAQASLVPRAPVVVFGAGSIELRLLTAKLASRAGHQAGVFAPDAKTAQSWRRLLYGREYAEANIDAEGCVGVLVGSDALGEALTSAHALCLVCDSAPMPEGTFDSLLRSSPQLQRVVLFSRMGVTRAKPPGPFGIGGEDAALLANEKSIRAALSERALDLTIIRVGVLKGGGPGGEQGAFRQGEEEFGLARSYVDGIAELETYMVTQCYDRFTLGAKCLAGDPVDLPNPLVRAAERGSFEPRDHETSRTAAAAAAVHALGHPSPVELSVAAERGEVPPSTADWEDMFSSLESVE